MARKQDGAPKLSEIIFKFLQGLNTYIVEPGKFVRFGIGPNVAFKVNIVALLDVFGVEGRAHF